VKHSGACQLHFAGLGTRLAYKQYMFKDIFIYMGVHIVNKQCQSIA